MILSCVIHGIASPDRGTGTPVTVTQGEVVAENYESLTEGERAILCSSLVSGNSIDLYPPDEGSVEVDTEYRTVEAKTFSASGLVWEPVSAKIVYADGEEEIELDEDGKGTFEYDGNVYSVEVGYDADISVPADVQSLLLNGPYYLWRGVLNLSSSYELLLYFDTISRYFNFFVRFTGDSVSDELKITEEDALAAIFALQAQKENNGGFDFEQFLFDYDEAPSSSEYLIEHGEEFKASLSEIYGQFSAISEISNLQAIYNSFSGAEKVKFRNVLAALNEILDSLSAAVSDPWAVLDGENNPLKSNMTGEDYEELDGLINGIDLAEYHDDEIEEILRAGVRTVRIDVNQYDVTVIYSANVIANSTIDSSETTPLETRKFILKVLAGTTGEDVKATVAEAGMEDIALSAWIDISEDDYVRSETALPETIESDTEYLITYDPKTVTAEYDFEGGLPASVPYGYNMTLPLHGGDDLVYDYDINGKRFLEGDTVKLTENVTVSRSEGKPWSAMKVTRIVADVYADELTEAERGVLSSQALKSDTVLYRTPTSSEGLVTVTPKGGSNYEVKASEYPSGIDGITWRPVSGKAINGSDTVCEFTFTGDKASFAAPECDKVEIEYGVVLTNISRDEILSIINVPAKLADEADDQTENMGYLDDNYENLGKLDKKTLKAIEIGVKGSDMSEEAKTAARTIIDGCVDDETKTLFAYMYLTDYRADGLAYYYRDKNYAKLGNQLDILRDNFNIIYSDPEFLHLLEDLDYLEYYDQIGDLLDEIKDITLAVPDPDIDVLSPSLSDLVSKIVELEGFQREFEAADKDLTLSATVEAAVPDAYIKGDADGDGEIAMSDVLLLRKNIAGISKLTEEQFLRADIDGDGYITMSDVLILRKIIAGISVKY